MMDVLLLQFNVNVIHLRNISDFCLQSVNRTGVMRSHASSYRQRVSAPVYNGCLAGVA